MDESFTVTKLKEKSDRRPRFHAFGLLLGNHHMEVEGEVRGRCGQLKGRLADGLSTRVPQADQMRAPAPSLPGPSSAPGHTPATNPPQSSLKGSSPTPALWPSHLRGGEGGGPPPSIPLPLCSLISIHHISKNVLLSNTFQFTEKKYTTTLSSMFAVSISHPPLALLSLSPSIRIYNFFLKHLRES